MFAKAIPNEDTKAYSIQRWHANQHDGKRQYCKQHYFISTSIQTAISDNNVLKTDDEQRRKLSVQSEASKILERNRSRH